jgi:hypothetical protein
MTIGRSAAARVVGMALLFSAQLAVAGERRCPAGVAEVRADDRVVWCAPSPDVALITRVVWSRDRRAIAFATEGRRGDTTLEVVLIGGRADLHRVSWPVPRRVRAAMRERGEPAVVWLGPQRVGFGHSEIRPALVASWTGGS